MEHQEHYFTNQVIPMIAACNPLLSPSDKIIYASISFLKKSLTRSCFASNYYLADYNQMSIASVEKSIKKLEQLEYISRKKTTKVIKEARGNVPAKLRSQRKIYIEENQAWNQLMDLWNWAFPQKKEKARDAWYVLMNELKNYKKEPNIEQIQTLICLCWTTIKFYGYVPEEITGASPAKIMVLLERVLLKKGIKNKETITLEKEIEKPPPSKKLPPKKYIAYSKKFYRQQKSNGGNQRITIERIHVGASTLEKLHRLNNFSLENEIIPALEWALEDDFWHRQIISLSSLRTRSKNGNLKFENMFIQFSSKRRPKTKKGGAEVIPNKYADLPFEEV